MDTSPSPSGGGPANERGMGSTQDGRPVPASSGSPMRARSVSAHARKFWAWSRRTRPLPYPRQIAAAAMAMFLVVGGLTTLLTLVLPHPADLHVPTMLVLGSAGPVAGLVVYRLRHRLPSSAYPWLLATTTVLLTVLIASSGTYSGMVSFSFFYTWIVLYAVLFFSPLGVAVQVALVAAGYATFQALYDSSDTDLLTPFEAVILVSVIATTSTVIAMLARAREDSEIDALTGVPNRRGLDRALDLALQAAADTDSQLDVAMIDVDHFKAINDQSGHAVGDQVLEQLATAWRPLLRSEDFIGRRGGDEFLVVLPRCPPKDATAILERLRIAAPVGVTCSIGAARWRAGDSASMLVSRADAALYQAKRHGRDRLAWASAHMDS